MIITAVAVGTRGDVNPLVDLGQEMIARGHSFRILAMEKFRPLIEEKGVTYLHLDGDADHVTQYLVTDYKTSMDFFTGMMKLKKENPKFMKQTMRVVRESDLVMYGLCAGFTYHICEYYHKPCVRVFYSPFDRTDKYSLYTSEHNSPAVGRSYEANIKGLNLMTMVMMNRWRRVAGLRGWKMNSDYRRLQGRDVLTLYPVSPMLMPPDPEWGDRVSVTGYWYHPMEDAEWYVPEDDLKTFLREGEQPIFVAFGKAESEELTRLQFLMLEALRETGIKAVVQADQIKGKERENTENLYFVSDVPYSWIFPRVKAVVHHGGCTTCGLGLYAGCPTLVIALALDQYYYGRTIHELGAGPKPLYIRKGLCTKEELKAALMELLEEEYRTNAEGMSLELWQEQGVETAAERIEAYMEEGC